MGKHEPRGELQLFQILYRTQILNKPIKNSVVLIPYDIMVTWPNLGTLNQGLDERLQQEGTTG